MSKIAIITFILHEFEQWKHFWINSAPFTWLLVIVNIVSSREPRYESGQIEFT